MTTAGACVLCGGGTFRTGANATPGCGELRAAKLELQRALEARQKLHEDFERYYADREVARLRADLDARHAGRQAAV